jgi:hypothetical protein
VYRRSSSSMCWQIIMNSSTEKYRRRFLSRYIFYRIEDAPEKCRGGCCGILILMVRKVAKGFSAILQELLRLGLESARPKAS